ncbi:MAG: ribosome-binding factor [Conexibacter sp.]|nr:ribosome-binding factor [Conexibacter sp.]
MRRVDGALLAVLSDAITQQLKDPRVGFVTVTAVKTSPDLRYARVYVSVLGDEDEREASLAGLRSAQGFLQKRVASELRLKHTPELSFEYDRSIDHGMRITELLDHELEHLPAAEPPESAEPDEPSEPSEPQREGGDET